MLISMYNDLMHLWLCLVIHVMYVILCLFIHCYTILPHDYTHSLRHPMFYKIVQLSSHMLLSVKLMLVNPCISLGGAPCTNLENKTLLCLIVEKL
jgi:hypothetical protein